MPMKKTVAAQSPDACIASLRGWPCGKYEMATLELVEGTPLERPTVVALARQAAALNAAHGDPTDLGVPA